MPNLLTHEATEDLENERRCSDRFEARSKDLSSYMSVANKETSNAMKILAVNHDEIAQLSRQMGSSVDLLSNVFQLSVQLLAKVTILMTQGTLCMLTF